MKVKIEKTPIWFRLVSDKIDELFKLLESTNKDFITYKQIPKFDYITKRSYKISVIDKIFFIKDRDSIRYHINKLPMVMDRIKSLLDSNEIKEIEVRDIELPKSKSISLSVANGFKPREDQLPYIELMSSDKSTVLINARTGFGKSFMVSHVISKNGKRAGFILLPRYIDKWIEDLEKYTDISKDDILVIKGNSSIDKLFSTDLEFKIVLISLTTMRTYIKKFIDGEIDRSPEEVMDKLSLDILVSDELHQEFHNVYKILLYSKVRKFIGLSATPLSSDYKINRLYKVIFPLDARVDGIGELSKYIDLVYVGYRFSNFKKVKYRGSMGYNHVKLEQSILYRNMKYNYFKMLLNILNHGYINRREKGDKALIFFSTIEMCEEFRDYLNQKLDYLTINKYTQEDDFSIIEESDIIISTLGSSGTALDIKNLITIIQTIVIFSKSANKQAIGRLREIPNKKMVYYSVYSNDIKQHIGYIYSTRKYFKDIVSSFKYTSYDNYI